MTSRSGVCMVGAEIAQQLFNETYPIGQVVYVQSGRGAFGCRVVGVLKSQNSNQDWNQPNLQLLLPYTYFQSVMENWWDAQIHEFVTQVAPDVDVEVTGAAI